MWNFNRNRQRDEAAGVLFFVPVCTFLPSILAMGRFIYSIPSSAKGFIFNEPIKYYNSLWHRAAWSRLAAMSQRLRWCDIEQDKQKKSHRPTRAKRGLILPVTVTGHRYCTTLTGRICERWGSPAGRKIRSGGVFLSYQPSRFVTVRCHVVVSRFRSNGPIRPEAGHEMLFIKPFMQKPCLLSVRIWVTTRRLREGYGREGFTLPLPPDTKSFALCRPVLGLFPTGKGRERERERERWSTFARS